MPEKEHTASLTSRRADYAAMPQEERRATLTARRAAYEAMSQSERAAYIGTRPERIQQERSAYSIDQKVTELERNSEQHRQVHLQGNV